QRVSDPLGVEDRLPARLPVARESEVVLLARHAGHDAADPGPATEVLPDIGNHVGLAARQIAEAERCQHGEQDSAALGEGARGHSMIRSARSSSDGGIVRPRTLAALRLITSSKVLACSTGSSAGFAPLRIRST